MVDAHDSRLIAALVVLRDRLDPVIEELLAGQLDQPDRDALAQMFRALADDLNRIVHVPADTAGEKRERMWPGWPTRGRFSASGP